MKHWTEYKGHWFSTFGKRKVYDNTIYTFDIETTSYLICDGQIVPACEFNEEEFKEKYSVVNAQSTMYIWGFGINEETYYGRTWSEFLQFLNILNEKTNYIEKIIYIFNLGFEFEFLFSHLKFSEVFSRKKRKPMKAICGAYEFRCALNLADCKLELLPEIYNLPHKKLVGSLNYNKLRHFKTKLYKREFDYLENDLLVLHDFIKFKRNQYGSVKSIPLTSTGEIRNELKDYIKTDWEYKKAIKRMVNRDPHIYNTLIDALMGGYVHANWIHINEIVNNAYNFDGISAYIAEMCERPFPTTAFTKANIKKASDMLPNFLYLFKVKFKHGKCILYNSLISSNKCRKIRNASYDNGRLSAFDEIEITVTSIDFFNIIKYYKDRNDKTKEMEFEILESYKSPADYLPRSFIKFILNKYIEKTKLKGIEERKAEYNSKKKKFNALFGVSLTNDIRMEVNFQEYAWDDDRPLSNYEISEKLTKKWNQPFMAMSIGVFTLSYMREDLFYLISKNDWYMIYSDTDSLILKEGFDKSFIDEYNNIIIPNRIKKVCEKYGFKEEDFSPEDIKGNKHTLGVFKFEKHYKEIKTIGAKQYAVKNDDNKIEISISGIPKANGSKCLRSLKSFNDKFVFPSSKIKKNMSFYNDNQIPIMLTDYKGETVEVNERSGVCLIPTDFTINLTKKNNTFRSSERARFKE